MRNRVRHLRLVVCCTGLCRMRCQPPSADSRRTVAPSGGRATNPPRHASAFASWIPCRRDASGHPRFPDRHRPSLPVRKPACLGSPDSWGTRREAAVHQHPVTDPDMDPHPAGAAGTPDARRAAGSAKCMRARWRTRGARCKCDCATRKTATSRAALATRPDCPPRRGRPDPSKCIACARTASRHRHGSPRRPERTWEAAAASCRVGTASANGISSRPANPPTAIAALDACPRTPHALQAFRMDRTRVVRAPARPTHGATGACRASTGAVGICTALDAVPCGSLRVRRHVAQDGASPHPSLGTAPTGGPRPSGVSPRTEMPRAPLPAASSLSADCRETTGCAKAPRGAPVTAVALFRYE